MAASQGAGRGSGTDPPNRPTRWSCWWARRWTCPACRPAWTTTPSCATCRPACLELLVNRPDIVAAEHRLKASNGNIGAARAAFLPSITLTGAFGTASAELDGLFSGGSRAWNFAPSISLPIFDAGRRSATVDLAEARRDQAVSSYEQTIQVAFRDVPPTPCPPGAGWRNRGGGVARHRGGAERARARLASCATDHGASPYLEVLDAQRDLLAAQQKLAQTRRALLSSRVRLYAALGGGTQASLPAQAAAGTTEASPR